ncbi:MAG: DNA-directed RNA polymerase subunit beta' [Armatimonadetes bacterium]|nr:DNA-directed RNA polymerase subunit beta' [Armatimonadota bacterium]
MADITAIKALRIGIASPIDIKSWSHGEVKKPETINYRTFKPERDGLFCERIFGPTKDWECSCGRYKKVKFKGVKCERCGVEVTRARVRRERMGHIELAAPVCHLWYLKGVPTPLGLLLDISPRLLEKVIYFTSYIVIDVDREAIQQDLEAIRGAIEEEANAIREEIEETYRRLDQELQATLEENKEEFTEQAIAEQVKRTEDRKELERKERFGHIEELEKAFETLSGISRHQLLDETTFRGVDSLLNVASRRLNKDLRQTLKAGLGAAAIRELLANIDLEKLSRQLKEEIQSTQGTRRARAIKRLEITDAFLLSKTTPDWMIVDVLPVLPPELRPMVQLDGGRFATSDLNDLYRRIINRNNRLKRIVEIRAPESIVNHEKRLLQESVDALIDNNRKAKPVPGSHNRPLKSLSDMLKGKEGRFRKNLLGKRVDYSGRSVIVVGPHLKLHQCGLPKEIALELFKPFVMHQLVKTEQATNIKTAKRLIDKQDKEVWSALETVIKEHPVLLNRAPTLHRLGIQAFEPILVEGKAIQVHPLVCHAYNADFDGDQMAVHVPLSYAAQAEARVLMLSTHNLFSPADGRPIVAPVQDIVLGNYYLTMEVPVERENQPMFASFEEAYQAFEANAITLHERISVRVADEPEEAGEETEPKIIETTLGRLFLNNILPKPLKNDPKHLVTLNKKSISNLVKDVYHAVGHARTVQFLDDLKNLGFTWASRGGISISVTDMEPNKERDEIIHRTELQVRGLNDSWEKGVLRTDERKEKVLRLWRDAAEDVAKSILKGIGHENPLFVITDSGARGSTKQLTQLAGMRGLMSDPFGNLIEDLPIRSNFHEGLSVFEYFVSTHGARKGLADTALRTADAGYLTRRLVDVAQDVIVRTEDCEATEGIVVCRIDREGMNLESLSDRIRGRYVPAPMFDPYSGDQIIAEREILTDEVCARIEKLILPMEALTQTIRQLPDRIGEITDEDLKDPETGEVLAEAFSEITEKLIQTLRARRDALKPKWEAAGFHWVEHDLVGVHVLSPLTCTERRGICARCYGMDMSTRKPVEIGTAVGIIAAQSIGEPGTQLTMRTFHTGGIASDDIVAVKDVKRQRSAALREIMSDESTGALSFTGEEMKDLRSEQQSILRRYIKELKGDLDDTAVEVAPEPVKKKRVSKKKLAEEAAALEAGEVPADDAEAETKETDEKLRKIVKNWTQKLVKLLETEIGGILRVEELFESRKPKGEAIIAEFEGEVLSIEQQQRGRWIVLRGNLPVGEQLSGRMAMHDIVHPQTGDVLVKEGDEITDKMVTKLRDAGVDRADAIDLVLVPLRGELEVRAGDQVRPGDRLTPGPLDPHKLLQLRGVRGVQDYLVREIQAVYKAQGVDINDRHIECIVRQMLKKRKIKESGSTYFLPGQNVDRFIFEDENLRAMTGEEPGKPATADWVLLGISEASLQTESFLSAASFQKTTRILTEAAVRGKQDELIGLKENVIIGRLIPAGTGFPTRRHVEVEREKRYIPTLEEQLGYEDAGSEKDNTDGKATVAALVNGESAAVEEEKTKPKKRAAKKAEIEEGADVPVTALVSGEAVAVEEETAKPKKRASKKADDNEIVAEEPKPKKRSGKKADEAQEPLAE